MTVVTVFLLLCKIPSQSTQPTRNGDNDEKCADFAGTVLFAREIFSHRAGRTEPEIAKALEKKVDALVMRELYTQYKTAPTEEEKEKARREYLDKRGVPDSFRW